MLSKRPRYALRLMVLLVSLDENGFHRTESLAERSEVSLPTLRKLVEALSHRGFVETKMGPTGGVLLARSTCEIHVLDYVHDRGELTHRSPGSQCCALLSVTDCFIETILEEDVKPRLEGTTLQDLVTGSAGGG